MVSLQHTFPLSKDIPLNIEIYTDNYPEKHWHQSNEILFLLVGHIKVIVDDQIISMQPEDIYLINSHSIHEINSSGYTLISVSFDLSKLKYVTSSDRHYFNVNSTKETASNKYNSIRSFIAQLVKVNATRDTHYKSLSLLYGLIDHLFSRFQSTLPLSLASNKHRTRIIEIIEYINTHYSENIQLNQLATIFSLSPSYLSSYFKINTGISFLKYYNDIRLNYAVNEMLSSSLPLEEIVYKNGFSDHRSFISLFKHKYNCIPSVYRKNNLNNGLQPSTNTSPNVIKGHSFDTYLNDMITLSKYLYLDEHKLPTQTQPQRQNLVLDGGIIDFGSEGILLTHNYKTICCVGSARQFLYSDIQDLLRTIQKDIGYKHVKFHGILSDEMMVYHEKKDGTAVYSFALIDKVVDFLMEIHLKPFMQLSFMPIALASDPSKLIDLWHYNTSPPKSIHKWNQLVKAVVEHLIDRYGIEEVKTWLFCVWNEPDGSTETFGWQDSQEFFSFYKETFMTVKSIDKNLKFGTPSLLIQPSVSQQWPLDFFHYSIENNCGADFLNIHYYDNSFGDGSTEVRDYFSLDNLEKSCPLNEDPLAFKRFINGLNLSQYQLNIKSPIFLTEWNLTVSQRDLINDTCFKSCYLTKNLLENYDRLESYGYWTLSDFIEEMQLPDDLYHGGLGMFTYNGIPKAHYNTFKFLSSLGDILLAQGNGYFVTKSTNSIIMILYNYEHFSKLFATGQLFDLTTDNRYTPFTTMSPVNFEIQINNIPSTGCLVKSLTVNREHGSSYDAWTKMGSKTKLNSRELDSLIELSKPKVNLVYETITHNSLTIKAELSPLEVRLIEVQLDDINLR